MPGGRLEQASENTLNFKELGVEFAGTAAGKRWLGNMQLFVQGIAIAADRRWKLWKRMTLPNAPVIFYGINKTYQVQWNNARPEKWSGKARELGNRKWWSVVWTKAIGTAAIKWRLTDYVDMDGPPCFIWRHRRRSPTTWQDHFIKKVMDWEWNMREYGVGNG